MDKRFYAVSCRVKEFVVVGFSLLCCGFWKMLVFRDLRAGVDIELGIYQARKISRLVIYDSEYTVRVSWTSVYLASVAYNSGVRTNNKAKNHHFLKNLSNEVVSPQMTFLISRIHDSTRN